MVSYSIVRPSLTASASSRRSSSEAACGSVIAAEPYTPVAPLNPAYKARFANVGGNATKGPKPDNSIEASTCIAQAGNLPLGFLPVESEGLKQGAIGHKEQRRFLV